MKRAEKRKRGLQSPLMSRVTARQHHVTIIFSRLAKSLSEHLNHRLTNKSPLPFLNLSFDTLISP